MDSSQVPSKPCSICNEPTPLKCKSCNSSAYCSPKCQKEDWSIHKLLCSQLAAFSTPPDTNFRRAIYFPIHEKAPKFVWVPVEKRRTWDGEIKDDDAADFTEWLGEKSFGFRIMKRNKVRNRVLDNEIQLTLKTRAYGSLWIPPLEVNECAGHVAKGKNISLWRGPILAMKKVGKDSKLYADINMEDLRDVADYFMATNVSMEM
jgi:hypothetical protein